MNQMCVLFLLLSSNYCLLLIRVIFLYKMVNFSEFSIAHFSNTQTAKGEKGGKNMINCVKRVTAVFISHLALIQIKWPVNVLCADLADWLAIWSTDWPMKNGPIKQRDRQTENQRSQKIHFKEPHELRHRTIKTCMCWNWFKIRAV